MLALGSVRAFRYRHRLSGLSCVAAALLLACSVFPDEAVLPAASAGSATAGNEAGAPSSEGGAGVGALTGGTGAIPVGGTTAAGGSSGGSPSGGGSGGVAGEGGEGVGQAGTGGVVVPTCDSPEQYVAKTSLDAWVGSVAPSTNHGDEPLLYVSGGTDERRALFVLTVPAAPAGAKLLRAEIVLSLESNADSSRTTRKLSLSLLQPPRTMREDKVTWTHFAQGNNNTWDVPGGDLGEPVAERTLPPGTTSGLVGFDVTAAVLSVLSSSASTHGVAVLETGAAPPAPAQLAFTSRESNASGSPAPELRLSYCPP